MRAAVEQRRSSKCVHHPTKITASLEDIFPGSGEMSRPLYYSPLEGLYGGIMLHEKLSRASATPGTENLSGFA